MTTATIENFATSALMPPWVRTFVAWMASNGRANKGQQSMSAADRALAADIQASASGDGDAYARIVRRHQATIARRMTRFSRDPNVVEELVHDTFVEAYYSLPRYRGDAPLEHWLQRIATRVGYRYWKRNRGTATVSFQEEVHGAPSTTASPQDDLAEEVASVLEKLPPRDRLVLTLLYIESNSVAEAAELAGWSQTMIKVQAYRARKKFHDLYNELYAATGPRSRQNG